MIEGCYPPRIIGSPMDPRAGRETLQAFVPRYQTGRWVRLEAGDLDRPLEVSVQT